jgi:hypothetical protein
MSEWGKILKNGEGREYVEKQVADAKLHHLNECLREIAPLVVGSNFAQERYPLAFNECSMFFNQKGELKSKSDVNQQMTTEPVSISYKLLEAANGHPHAKIPWPHRLLHDASARIVDLEAQLAEVNKKYDELRLRATAVIDEARGKGCLTK